MMDIHDIHEVMPLNPLCREWRARSWVDVAAAVLHAYLQIEWVRPRRRGSKESGAWLELERMPSGDRIWIGIRHRGGELWSAQQFEPTPSFLELIGEAE